MGHPGGRKDSRLEPGAGDSPGRMWRETQVTGDMVEPDSMAILWVGKQELSRGKQSKHPDKFC